MPARRWEAKLSHGATRWAGMLVSPLHSGRSRASVRWGLRRRRAVAAEDELGDVGPDTPPAAGDEAGARHGRGGREAEEDAV
jgi:hypothetical protein